MHLNPLKNEIIVYYGLSKKVIRWKFFFHNLTRSQLDKYIVYNIYFPLQSQGNEPSKVLRFDSKKKDEIKRLSKLKVRIRA